ncbi:MAG: DUF1015 domain-containing protein [Phycisphaeraceae bacterium]|nr:DUF1015 domain-containing protein [Phycisphaeraceae bacterium]
MPEVFPFRAVQYTTMTRGRSGAPADVSAVIAPPYDVLDAGSKGALLRQSAKNIVAIDLPHLPAKQRGPDAVYERAAAALRGWLGDGTLTQRSAPAMFVYRERFTFAGSLHERTGMACTLEVVPFGPRPGAGGVLPHEETFSGPKEDRMALMGATRAQLSPIFGLHQDERGEATGLLKRIMSSRGPDATARTEAGFGGEVTHEAWTVDETPMIEAYQAALRGEDVFIADGHHRYTTALNYLTGLEAEGAVGRDHPARRCMFVLVSMSDPGMVIGPTHRVLGGMKEWSFERFAAAAKGVLEIRECGGDVGKIEGEMAKRGGEAGVLGLYDFAAGRCYVCSPAAADPLAKRFPDRVPAWRNLDVAIVQYVIVEGICQPALNGGEAVKWAFPHSIEEMIEIGEGKEKGSGGGGAGDAQLAVIVRPTPLEAVREISRAGELMPQKSTFFYPKLATGLFVNPLA